jgi:hypothetical protein
MKHLIWTFALTAALAAPLPAAGQHAVPRGGGSDGGGGGGGGTSSSGGSSGGGGGTSSSSGSSSSDGGSTWAPPRHPGGSSSSGRSRGDSGSTASGRRSPGASSAGSGSGSGYGSDRVVGGTNGRTRDGRPITGYAVPRGTVVPSGRPGGDYYYYPRGTDWYYSPWYYSRYSPYYFSGFGASIWGLGYIWDPFWFGGPGYGYGDPWGYGGGGGGYAGGGGSYDDGPDEVEGQGALRIKVKPREAKVLVDGTFAGTVDDFDGNFQKLRLDEGTHKVELQADGFEPLRFDVLIVDGQTVTYKGQLRQR